LQLPVSLAIAVLESGISPLPFKEEVVFGFYRKWFGAQQDINIL
jgi:hypothetical protein